MADERKPADPAMSDILASIRRIVADEGGVSPGAGASDVFELTPQMRIDGGEAPPPPQRPSGETFDHSFGGGAGPSSSAAQRGSGKAPAAVSPAPPPPAASPPSPTVFSPGPTPEATAPKAGASGPAAPSGVGGDDQAASAPDLDGLDEAAVADIVRAVLRQEFAGDFGKSLTQQIRVLIQREVARQIGAQTGRPPGPHP
jgi:hypothetical protein